MAILLTIYAILLFFGGYIGYTKAKSKVSLIMGAVSGALVLIGLLITDYNLSLGYGLIAVTAAVLCVAFTQRLRKTKKIMPSGLLLMLSIIALLISLLPFFT